MFRPLPVIAKMHQILSNKNATFLLGDVALLLVLLHPTLLLFAPEAKFKFIDIIFPINAPNQKLFVAMGTLSMFAIITVIITTQKIVKKKMSFRTWKNIHLISHVTLLLFIVHGIVMDPQLKDRPLMLLDAEKVLSELCLIVLVAASVLRYKYYIKTKKLKMKKLSNKIIIKN